MTEFIKVELTPEQIAERKAWEAGAYDREVELVKQARHSAYTAAGGSDAVYLKYQRGEATKEEWLDAVQAINDANPYPVKEGK
jgi:alkylhydroperoxidase family enzyme